MVLDKAKAQDLVISDNAISNLLNTLLQMTVDVGDSI